ncbi:F-box only protein 21-like [Anoplolepis gracilipes]|uniref:F-box only protein 21-like n=1 Tax=Anoplolepis gracilipes TaxID=354296 RepID=UPI003B9E5F42
MSLKKFGLHYAFHISMDNFEMPITRPEEVKFAVGMIVRHSDESTDCFAGVIIGWYRYEDRYSVKFRVLDRRYYPNIFPIKICTNTKEQTHYLILTENNEMCYVGKDAITLTTPKWIENSEIGRYFDKFEGTYYVPNKTLEKRYPHDSAVTVAKTVT